jgi:hypothetical protein
VRHTDGGEPEEVVRDLELRQLFAKAGDQRLIALIMRVLEDDNRVKRPRQKRSKPLEARCAVRLIVGLKRGISRDQSTSHAPRSPRISSILRPAVTSMPTERLQLQIGRLAASG